MVSFVPVDAETSESKYAVLTSLLSARSHLIMANRTPPDEFIYSVTHLLIYSFSIYLKCARYTVLHREKGGAEIIRIFR